MRWGPVSVAVQKGRRKYDPPCDERDCSLEEEIELCVKRMAETKPLLHLPFIAYHLGRIGDQDVMQSKPKDRAALCGIPVRMYYRRVKKAELYVEDWIKAKA